MTRRLSAAARLRRDAFLASLPEDAAKRHPAGAWAWVFIQDQALGRPLGNPLLQTGPLPAMDEGLLG